MILPDQYTSLLYEHLHPLKDFMMNDMVESGSAVDCSMIMETLPIPKEQEVILNQLLLFLRENELEALFIISPMKLDSEMSGRIVAENI